MRLRLFLLSILIGGMIGCTAKPEPLVFGRDACYTCKMTLMDRKFGAELVTQKGKVYKFDDLNCMLSFYNSGYEDVSDFKFIQVVDFANPEMLIDAHHAWYLKSDNIRTPMASEVAAFEQEEATRQYKKEWSGILMSWGEVQTQFK
ncbi:MAG: nitrous oxide reductase accessory protein NosL [Cyclobacteriaceae bacterium]|nr:nitrous oxide reductase accessory protein NosL [Cyclobacteriaceae bacterium]